MGQLEDIAPALAILLEGIAEEFNLHQEQLPPDLEPKLIKALLEAHRVGGRAVYNRRTFTPQPIPAITGNTLLPRPRVPTQDFDKLTVHHIKKDTDDD